MTPFYRRDQIHLVANFFLHERKYIYIYINRVVRLVDEKYIYV